MLAAQAPVTACHSEFQMAPIFPLMARRSGRQPIGEGGPRHAACSRGSIRGKRGRGEVRSITPVVMYSFFLFLWLFWRLLSHLGLCGMADCSISASGWVADGGAALPSNAASHSRSSPSQCRVYLQCRTEIFNLLPLLWFFFYLIFLYWWTVQNTYGCFNFILRCDYLGRARLNWMLRECYFTLEPLLFIFSPTCHYVLCLNKC